MKPRRDKAGQVSGNQTAMASLDPLKRFSLPSKENRVCSRSEGNIKSWQDQARGDGGLNSSNWCGTAAGWTD